jgi:signal transduction histidine kinase
MGTFRQEKNICLYVRDQGIGIPEVLQPKVFEMFTEARRPGTAQEKSFGLGLSICRQIVEAHQGHIWLESSCGSGTTFYISLPDTLTPDTLPVFTDGPELEHAL